ncbi:MAG: hypothetical protein KAQ74_07045 [Dehalococcoidia bacterium]|nr:hypothetical protein [Dehalococcoidia bacterium]
MSHENNDGSAHFMKAAARNGALQVLLMVLLLACVATGCLMVKDSPAPGCRKYVGVAPLGGCNGKSAILDLVVEPELDGILIEVNNCNGGIIEITNDSGNTLIIGGIRIDSSEHHVGLDVVGEENGSYVLQRTCSNFSEYVPEEDEKIEVVGKLGQQELRVSYVKTAMLC